METLEAIYTRRSIRKFTSKHVSDDMIKTIIEAGMFAPSARNQQPWHFIVINKKSLKDLLMKAHPYASMLSEAPLAILVCGDTDLELSSGYWPIDCSAATQNILLASHASGLASVWLGVEPRRERKDAIREIFKLPENIQPFALIALGYPDEKKRNPERWKPERVHFNGWGKNH